MVDLKKNETSMKEAWQSVTDLNSSVDWALFGYEGQSSVLKVISTGEDGIEELMEDLNPSKIMYGFLSVQDPKTSLPKYVLLNWQGETAPGGRKGACAMHLRDIEHFLCGHHLTVHVRNEDDIDMDSIVKKVSEISSSTYNFKAKPQGMEHSPEPVGTAHKKINPLQELPKMSEREKFWSKDQDEERSRIIEEKERRVSESRRVEEERKCREEKENLLREGQIKEKEREISELRERERNLEDVKKKIGSRKMGETAGEDVLEAKERTQRSDKMRQERNEEAKALILQRPSEAKKIFTRNSSQGQMNLSFQKSSPSAMSDVPIPAVPCDQVDKAAGEDVEQPRLAPPPGFQEEEAVTKPADDLHRATPVTLDKDGDRDLSLESYGVCAVSLYDYQASDETEISFDPGQIITHIDQIDPGWWQGLGPDGGFGLFPANYVEIIDNSELQIQT